MSWNAKRIVVGLCVAKDQYILLTKVGNGYSDDERKSLLKKLAEKK